MRKTTSGFTIVELLIVIVVVAILAAITIVAYNGIQDRTQSSTLQADLVNAKKKMLLYQIDQGQFPPNAPALGNADISATEGVYDVTGNNFYYCYNVVTKEFAMGARTAISLTAYTISSTSGLQKINGVGANQVCQAAGLTGYTDPNAFSTNGYGVGTGWQSWVK